MPFPVFEQAYLLQSLGWAIANSFWQTGILWLLYKAITNADRKLPALVKHHLSVSLLIGSFIWFIVTIAQNYLLLSNARVPGGISLADGWRLPFQPLSNTLPLLSLIYLLLLCLYTARFLKNFSHNHFLKTEGLSKAPVDIRLFITKTALHLGIKRKIRVWLSAHVDVPSVTGFIKPVILLPAAMINHLSIQQTEAILLHELAHIRRNDYLINFFQSVIELILFFNPFAVLLGKIAKKERENCCDDWVLNFRYDHYEYAKALLVLEEQRNGDIYNQNNFTLAATNSKRNLLHRVKRLFNTDPQTNFSFLQKFKLVSLCVLLLAMIFALLPGLTNKKIDTDTGLYDVKEKPELVKSEQLPSENNLKLVFTALPAAAKAPPKPKVKPAKSSIKPKKKCTNDATTGEYVNAFINEELLSPQVSEVTAIATQAVETEVKAPKFLIKIEEQQSGKKLTNTYYFELNNKDGGPAIKPLIMLNRFKAVKLPVFKTILGHLPASLDTMPRPFATKKITS